MSPLSSESRGREAKAGTCPICKNLSVARFRPFCSKRCADLDLAHWLHGGYAIPAVDQDSQEDSGPPAELPQGG
ncbi:MAG: DNA gyrase inhibitor YacG [Rhizomicrobium sp.]